MFPTLVFQTWHGQTRGQTQKSHHPPSTPSYQPASNRTKRQSPKTKSLETLPWEIRADTNYLIWRGASCSNTTVFLFLPTTTSPLLALENFPLKPKNEALVVYQFTPLNPLGAQGPENTLQLSLGLRMCVHRTNPSVSSIHSCLTFIASRVRRQAV